MRRIASLLSSLALLSVAGCRDNVAHVQKVGDCWNLPYLESNSLIRGVGALGKVDRQYYLVDVCAQNKMLISNVDDEFIKKAEPFISEDAFELIIYSDSRLIINFEGVYNRPNSMENLPTINVKKFSRER